jgi:hypothetical protein
MARAKDCASSRVFIASGPLTRNFTGQPTGGKLQRAHPRQHVGEGWIGGESVLQPDLHAVAQLEALGDNDRLGEEIVAQLRVERQIEADSALADVKAPMIDIGIVLEQLLDTRGDVLRGVEGGALRQVEIDEQLRPVGRREELLLHELQARERQQEQPRRRRQHQPPAVQRPLQHAPEPARETGAPVLAVALDRGRQDGDARQRREQYRHDPRHGQRDGHDREQREAIFARAARREAHRHEAGDGDERAGQRGKAVDV